MINRENYETFFLLYIDNELEAAQRLAVEKFVAAHPDLRAEFDGLQQTLLTTDEPVFANKASLYKKETGISLQNYENYFLLAVDDELTNNEQVAVETFVLQHPALQNEFTLLKQTKLAPEPVEFANKQVLYRKEQKERRLVPFYFMRVGMAAALLGIIAMLWNMTGEQVKNKVAVSPARNVVPAAAKSHNNTTATIVQQVRTPDAATPKSTKLKPQILVKKAVQIANKIKSELPIEQAPTQVASITTQAKANAIEPSAASLVTHNSSRTIIDRAEIIDETINAETQARQASYTYANNPGDDDNNSLLIGGAEINKNKIRGLLKKASSFFDRKLKSSSDKTIQIANFELNSK